MVDEGIGGQSPGLYRLVLVSGRSEGNSETRQKNARWGWNGRRHDTGHNKKIGIQEGRGATVVHRL